MRGICAAAISVLLFASATARGDSEVLDAASEARFKEGVAFAKQGKYEQARASFLQTLSLSPGNTNVLLNLAVSEHGAGHPVEALGHLKTYLASPKADPKKAQEVRSGLYDELWKATSHVRIQADGGAPLTLDTTTKLGNAPLADLVDVAPGKHTFATQAKSVDVTVAAGETKEVNLTADRPATPPTVPNHQVEEPPREVAHESAARWIVPVGLGVLAAGGLALGIGFASASRNKRDEAAQTNAGAGGHPCADRGSATCSQYEDSLSSGNTDKTISIVGYIAAGTLAAGALATFLFWPKDSSRTSGTQLTPVVGPGHASLELRLSF